MNGYKLNPEIVADFEGIILGSHVATQPLCWSGEVQWCVEVSSHNATPRVDLEQQRLAATPITDAEPLRIRQT